MTAAIVRLRAAAPSLMTSLSIINWFFGTPAMRSASFCTQASSSPIGATHIAGVRQPRIVINGVEPLGPV